MQSGPNVTPRILWTLFDKAWENGDVNTMLSLIFWVEEIFLVEERIEKSISATEVEFLYTQLELMTSLYLNKVREE